MCRVIIRSQLFYEMVLWRFVGKLIFRKDSEMIVLGYHIPYI